MLKRQLRNILGGYEPVAKVLGIGGIFSNSMIIQPEWIRCCCPDFS
jgi:hypothetical protein